MREETTPLTIWFGFFGSTPNLIDKSILSSNFLELLFISFNNAHASLTE